MSEVRQIPMLRFKEFSDEWKKVILNDVATFSKGKSISKSDIVDDGKTECIRYGELYTTYNEVINEIISKTNLPKDSLVFSKSNDVIIPSSGETQLDIATASCVLKDNIALGGDLNIIRTKENGVFISYYLNSTKKKSIASLAQGNSVVHIYNHHLQGLKLNIPKKEEQNKIATFLTAVDKKITQLQEKKTLLEQYKKGITQKIFSQQQRFKDDNRNEYPDWEEKELGQIGSVINGLTYSPKDIDKDGVLVLRSSNVQNRLLTFDDNVYVNVEEGNYNPVKENDILICVRNGSKRLIGKNAIIDKQNEGIAFGAFMAIYRSEYNPFLFHLFDTDFYKKQVHRNLGATINSINGSDLRKFKMPLPSIKEQTKIANFLSAIDAKIQLVNTQLENTQQFKKGLLQQMFI